jgi:mycothiol synthase
VVSLEGADVLPVLLEWQREQAGDRELITWLRFSTEDELAAAEAAGFTIRRRLGVVGRGLATVDVADPPDDLRIRAVTNEDLDGVLAVLLDAYDGTDDGGWTRDELERRRAYPWYRDRDLLVASTPDHRIAGIHWTKQRTTHRGETYNLAIAPWAQGKGLGRALLTAGMAHLADIGLDEIILWVDRSNHRALKLYDSVGFETLWDDVALT